MRRWKSVFHVNGNERKSGVLIPISDKTDFKTNTVTRDKEGHYIMIKGSIHQENIMIVNIYESNIAAPKYKKQKQTQLKGK